MLDTALANLLSPPILCFVLGLVAGALRSDLEIPEAVAKGLALYLIFAIGFKGGAALAQDGGGLTVLPSLAVGMALGAATPLVAVLALRRLAGLPQLDAAAIAAHYGSVSVVTYVTAADLLRTSGVGFEPFMPAVLAAMEAPGIVVALLLARGGEGGRGVPLPEILREVLVNGAVVLLLGSLVIGMVVGDAGAAKLAPVVEVPFTGILAFFLLDMGLVVARRFTAARPPGVALIVFALATPLAAGAAGALGGAAIGLTVGGTALLATLAASASYIAAPAALRLALPRANPSVPLMLALGITFPFNIVLGIPLYVELARILAG